MRLLVVEDSPLLRKMFGLAFPHQSNELHPAENGRIAMELLAVSNDPFDAVLLDLRMPDMDGVEFIRGLRGHPVHRTTPVILTTAEADGSPLLAQASQLGVAAVVKKPWSPQALRNVVQRVLDSPRG
ncbi:MAG TPA: response regulator [Gemmatimonadales bacterium]|jgi:CheY-like chemotaxis protein